MQKSDRLKIKAVAIGGFDGVHVGHKELLKRLGENGLVVVIETEHANLTPKGHREKHINYPLHYFELGDIMQLTPKEFIEMLLDFYPKLEKIVVGYDFKFGYKRSASAQDIKKYFEKRVVIVDEVKVKNISVHSRTIRGFLRVGDIIQANELLGRRYSVEGDVIRGQGLGMTRLYATLNLNVREFLLPSEGVYATVTKIGADSYDSVTFIGHRVTTDGAFSVETHILDKEIKETQTACVEFVEKIRDNMMFCELEALKAQISDDIKKAREILKH